MLRVWERWQLAVGYRRRPTHGSQHYLRGLKIVQLWLVDTFFQKLFTRPIGSIHYWGPKPCKWWGLRVYKEPWQRAKGHTSTSSAFSLALEKHKVSELSVLPLSLMDEKIKAALKESSGYKGFRIFGGWQKDDNGRTHSSDCGVFYISAGLSEKKMDFCTWNGASVMGSLRRTLPRKTIKCMWCCGLCHLVTSEL